MGKNKRMISYIAILLLITIGISMPVSAAGERLDSYIVEVNATTYVKVSITDYGKAFALKDISPLYVYLKGENQVPKIVAFVSVDKYIAVAEYGKQFALNNKDASKAIEKSQALPLETVKTFWEFKGFDENGDPILVPVIPDEEPTEPTAKLTITPDPILKNNFNLASVKANILGVENVDKYAIKYSVKDANDNKHYVTTKKANIRQTNPDLIQYIEGETELEVLIYDVGGKLIVVENLKVEIN